MSGNRRTVKGSYGLVSLWNEGQVLPKLTRWGILFQHYLQAWRGLLVSPLTSLITIATIAASLLLFGGFVLFLENARELLLGSEATYKVSVYLKDSADSMAIEKLQALMESEPTVAHVTLLTKEQALADFRKTLGDYSSVLEGVESQNPLPASLEVVFRQGDFTEQSISDFRAKFGRAQEIDQIQYSEGAISQVVSFMRLLRSAGVFAILFMFLMTGFIIANTIKLALYSHRDEIQIMRLVGAHEWTVKAPFLIEGCLQGVLGGGLSVVVLFAAYAGLKSIVVSSSILTYFIPHFHFLSISAVVLVVFTGIGVGIAGSFFAVRRGMPSVD